MEPFGRLSCLSVICGSEPGIQHISDISILLEVHDKQEQEKKEMGCVLSSKGVLCFHIFLRPMPIKTRTDLMDSQSVIHNLGCRHQKGRRVYLEFAGLGVDSQSQIIYPSKNRLCWRHLSFHSLLTRTNTVVAMFASLAFGKLGILYPLPPTTHPWHLCCLLSKLCWQL